jgi:hypothetical protein
LPWQERGAHQHASTLPWSSALAFATTSGCASNHSRYFAITCWREKEENMSDQDEEENMSDQDEEENMSDQDEE